MKKILCAGLALFIANCAWAQEPLRGRVVNRSQAPLSGATVILKATGQHARSDENGYFVFPQSRLPDTLLVTHIGYSPYKTYLTRGTGTGRTIVLQPVTNELDEVEVNTGYYSVPQERATGAFTQVDNKLLNRSVSTNILDRLEGVTNSLLFDRSKLTGENTSGQPDLRVRGLSTIEADSRPLIVVDNFPYEGDLSSINPNTVESVTVLRDAAAASIWGARAGNGVIVINTKQGKYNQPTRISWSSNVNIINKPDLFYSQDYLPASTVMDIQKELFSRGTYSERDQTPIPTYVELLIKQRDHLVSDAEFASQEAAMRSADLRRDATEYLYQPGINQQYALSVNGGEQAYRYMLNAGYDRNRANLIGDKNNRATISMQNSFKLKEQIEFTGSIWYARQESQDNGQGMPADADVDIYERLVDEHGKALPVNQQLYRYAYHESAPQQGLLDWMSRPLDEIRLTDRAQSSNELRLNAGLKYRMLRYVDLNATYQYIQANLTGQTLYDKDSYFVRDMVNTFTQQDGTRIIPYADIMDYAASNKTTSHSGRVQLNYTNSFHDNQQLAVLAGAEIRHYQAIVVPGSRLYDYNSELWTGRARFDYLTEYPTRPSSTQQLILGPGAPAKATNNNLSYFGNASYTLFQKYILSGSARWDGSNLLGVKANQKGTLLWSAGGSWQFSDESFYKPLKDVLPYARLRMTYGSAGNIDKSQSHYPTISINTNAVTQLPQATLTSPGNPALRWEQVNTLNMGLDWRIRSNRLNGSIEYYNKLAKHLLGDNLMDPTAGAGDQFKMNYANLRTQGWDFQVNSKNLTGGFQWESTFLLSYSKNRITKYYGPIQNFSNLYFSSPQVKQGSSVDLVYALPWHGLNPETGYPLIYDKEGKISSDYAAYYSPLPLDSLQVAGISVPPVFGSLRNTFSWKNIQFSFLISFKTGFVFRRNSISSGIEYLATPTYHMDYFKRWKQPGDEKKTDVPAYAETFMAQRSNAYLQSEALITPGDAVRLQDINLSYSLEGDRLRNLNIKQVRIFLYAKNLGILWRKNDQGLDPDYPGTSYPAQRSFALGLQADF